MSSNWGRIGPILVLSTCLTASLLPWRQLPGAEIPHGLPATESNCIRCHDPADFSIIRGDSVHQDGSFRLVGAHAEAPCKACHEVDEGFANLTAECSACHAGRDAHRRLVGDDCAACHDPRGWVPNRFRHAQTGYMLTGAHRAASCEDCHATGFPMIPTDCVYCHQSEFLAEGGAAHSPEDLLDCDRCHNTFDWERVRYAH